MKRLIFVTLFVMGWFVTAVAQNAKVIALVNKASWCHVCKENGPRVEKDLMPMMMQNKNVLMVVNDLSDDKSMKDSHPMIEKAGITSFAKANKATGMIYFLDAKNKKLISKISLARSNEDIKMAFMNAVSKK